MVRSWAVWAPILQRLQIGEPEARIAVAGGRNSAPCRVDDFGRPYICRLFFCAGVEWEGEAPAEPLFNATATQKPRLGTANPPVYSQGLFAPGYLGNTTISLRKFRHSVRGYPSDRFASGIAHRS
jgi:hypothetical protein